jgi:hypothetical protein
MVTLMQLVQLVGCEMMHGFNRIKTTRPGLYFHSISKIPEIYLK